MDCYVIVLISTDENSIWVNSFGIEIQQQDGYFDNIEYGTGDPLLRITAVEKDYWQGNADITIVANSINLQLGWMVNFVLDKDTDAERVIEEPVSDNAAEHFEVKFTGVNIWGEHIIHCYVTDDFGTVLSYQGTQDKIETVTGDYYVAVGNSITRGSGDDYPSDDTSLDGRNSGGGYEPILNNILTLSKGYPHTVVNEGISGTTSSDWMDEISSVLSRRSHAQYFLIQLGTNDAKIPGGATPSGLGMQPGVQGYEGTFKHNIQQLITAIITAGRTPYLARVPFAGGNYFHVNGTISEYNAVIDELVWENNIAVEPPDFYSHFESHQDELRDNLHPNGIGYQSMADLWFRSLSQ